MGAGELRQVHLGGLAAGADMRPEAEGLGVRALLVEMAERFGVEVSVGSVEAMMTPLMTLPMVWFRLCQAGEELDARAFDANMGTVVALVTHELGEWLLELDAEVLGAELDGG